MTRKTGSRKGASKHGHNIDSSHVNDRAGPRRRLLRALGGSGGVALGAILAPWKKPMVDSILLPAHAQTTVGEVGCSISIESTMQPTSENSDALAFSATLAVRGTDGVTHVGASASASGASLALSGDGTFPAGTYTLGIDFSGDALASYAVTYNATCCDAIREEDQIGLIGFVTGSTDHFFVDVDDGSCSFLF